MRCGLTAACWLNSYIQVSAGNHRNWWRGILSNLLRESVFVKECLVQVQNICIVFVFTKLHLVLMFEWFIAWMQVTSP